MRRHQTQALFIPLVKLKSVSVSIYNGLLVAREALGGIRIGGVSGTIVCVPWQTLHGGRFSTRQYLSCSGAEPSK